MRTIAPSSRFGSARHLARRFVGSMRRAPPAPEEERWALEQLLPRERELWRRMAVVDRRHAVEVARESQRLLREAGCAPRREVLAAALLHDVGKVESQLGTFARVGATFTALALGRQRLEVGRAGARLREYLQHDRIGAELLRRAGSDPLTVAWAEQHHLDPELWTIDRRIGQILKAADEH